jgi:M6 family metalloprotease-like protein
MRRFKGIFIVLITVFIHFTINAAWLNFVPQTINQPDGTVIDCFATGDEFYNWLHDRDGYTIIQSQEDGFYYYAKLVDDDLVPSAYMPGSVDPIAVGLSPWTNISPQKMQRFRADFLENEIPEKPQIPGYKALSSSKNTGTLNNLVVYIRFSDQTEFTQDTLFYYDMFNSESAGYNSMRNYFAEVSYQQLDIPSWFYPVPANSTVISYQDIYERSYYMPYSPTNPNGYQSSQKTEREHKLLKRAIDFIATEVPSDLNIDYDDDGYVDNVVFNIRGGTTAWATLLWPHRWVLYSEDAYVNGKQVWDYNFQLEERLNENGNGTLSHEMFHSLSATDLYHYSTGPYTPVGPWDVMGENNNPPQSMGAYMKFRYGGWIDDIPVITECGTYSLNPLTESENSAYKIASPNSVNEYFVLEYRVKEGVFEGGIPGSGLLVYRIDQRLSGDGNSDGPPDEVYLYRPNGTTSTNGNLNSAMYGADYGRTEINEGTNPSSFLQNGQPGGLQISNIGTVGETISFDVYFDKEPIAQFEASDTLITEGCSVDFYDLSVCEVDQWEWNFEGGTPASSTDQNPSGIIFTEEGFHSVTLTTSNSWGSDVMVKESLIHVSTISDPQVSFLASDTLVCTGEVVQLLDFSMVCPESWLWEINPETFEFVNGTSASDQNPEVQFYDSGAYTVGLTATNANGSSSQVIESYIRVGGKSLPYFEDFESGSAVQLGWTIINPDNDGVTWNIFAVSGDGGSKAAGINLFNYPSVFKRDQLVSPPIDLSGTTLATLTFDHAYALWQNPTYSDSLIVLISDDCGDTWTRILELADDGNGSFATHPLIDYEFIPTVEDDWCGNGYGSSCFESDISAWAGKSDVKIMFESVRIAGNNLFIDNVNIDLHTNTEENLSVYGEILVYPNPAKGQVVIESTENIHKVWLFNQIGQVVLQEPTKGQSVVLNVTDLGPGIYFMQILMGDHIVSEKLLIRK